ncbi:MAG: hypothetical protein VSS75_031680, partial [Candidatus Parabeggiatoa sp.]|nr:hypothetical protein [Candidatus Parabeggiatoa sp.]
MNSNISLEKITQETQETQKIRFLLRKSVFSVFSVFNIFSVYFSFNRFAKQVVLIINYFSKILITSLALYTIIP